jgi:hypothetical protein
MNSNIETYAASELWMAGVLSLGLVLITVLFHYEALRIYTNLLARPSKQSRIRILQLVFGLFLLHMIEILIFAVMYKVLHTMGLGELKGLDGEQLFFYFYYSAVVYTTLGFGDILPFGPLKVLTAMEGLIGLGFITWSASFTFLEMQRYWQGDEGMTK